MKAVFLFLMAFNVTPVIANELLPVMPDTKAINKGLNPVKGGCDQCEVSQTLKSPLINPAISKSRIDKVQAAKSTLACVEGRKRLQNDVSFFTNSVPTNKGVVVGNFQPGFLTNGTVSDLYVGVSAFKDLMFVTKVTSGDKVVGYNVTISFCELPNSYKDMPGVISDSRSLENFAAPKGIALTEKNSACGFGSVVSFPTSIVSRRDPASAYSIDAPISTSFLEYCKN